MERATTHDLPISSVVDSQHHPLANLLYGDRYLSLARRTCKRVDLQWE